MIVGGIEIVISGYLTAIIDGRGDAVRACRTKVGHCRAVVKKCMICGFGISRTHNLAVVVDGPRSAGSASKGAEIDRDSRSIREERVLLIGAVGRPTNDLS